MNTFKKPLGRPPKPAAEILEHRSIRLTAAQWAKVDAAGLAAPELLEALTDCVEHMHWTQPQGFWFIAHYSSPLTGSMAFAAAMASSFVAKHRPQLFFKLFR